MEAAHQTPREGKTMGKRTEREKHRMEGEDCNGSELTYKTPDGETHRCKVQPKDTPPERRDKFLVAMENPGESNVVMGMSANAGWVVGIVFEILRENPEVDKAVRGRILFEMLGAMGKLSKEVGGDDEEEAFSRFDKTMGKGRAH